MAIVLGTGENVLGVLALKEQAEKRLLMYLLCLSAVSDIMFFIHRFERCRVVASAGANCKRLAEIWTAFIHKLNF